MTTAAESCYRVVVRYAGMAWAPIVRALDEQAALAKAFEIVKEQRTGCNMQTIADYGFVIEGISLIHLPDVHHCGKAPEADSSE